MQKGCDSPHINVKVMNISLMLASVVIRDFATFENSISSLVVLWIGGDYHMQYLMFMTLTCITACIYMLINMGTNERK